jgi:hypothetical protein
VPSRKLNIYAPAAMVRYFDALSASLRDGAATDERLAAIAEASSMEVSDRCRRATSEAILT